MDVEQILDIVHQTAAEMMAAKGGEVIEHGRAVSTEGADSLIDRYGFSSIDALECLLILEEKFGIVFRPDATPVDMKIETIADLARMVERMIAEQGATGR